MFKQSERLSRLAFTKFFKIGKRFHAGHLTIIYSDSPTTQAAVVVSKKVSKHAVRRNKIRRRIYERLRNSLKENNKTGIFIIVVKPSFNSLSRAIADEFVIESIASILESA